MLVPAMKITKLFSDFFESEKFAGLVLLLCTAISLLIANSSLGQSYLHFLHFGICSKPIDFWINDGLMTIFFLLVGLEIEREIYTGELSHIKKSLLPVICAIGGMAVPALIHFAFNHGSAFEKGFGIPMATDIAFSLAVLSLLGNKVPLSLKIFLTALAIIDDLGAIVVIALFYSKSFSLIYFGSALFIFAIMFILNRRKFHHLWVYLILGGIMWFCIHRSGIHSTIAGVLLAFVIPFGNGDEKSPSYNLQHYLHKPVAFFILPLFALANTAIFIPASVISDLTTSNSYGIIWGLLIGKPLGIFLFGTIGISIGLCSLPSDIKRQHLLWTGLLAGIGFTMSIFITLLAFDDHKIVDTSKIAIIIGSVCSAVLGYIGLKLSLKPTSGIKQNN